MYFSFEKKKMKRRGDTFKLLFRQTVLKQEQAFP